MAEFVNTPMKPIASPPASNKGGPGEYDGVEGYPKRTSSPNAVPEKVCEAQPEKKIASVDTPIEKISNYGTD